MFSTYCFIGTPLRGVLKKHHKLKEEVEVDVVFTSHLQAVCGFSQPAGIYSDANVSLPFVFNQV